MWHGACTEGEVAVLAPNCREDLIDSQIGKFAECAGDLSYVQIACVAVFVSLNNSSIVSFCCATKISRLEPRLKFKVRGREIGRARQTFQSGSTPLPLVMAPKWWSSTRYYQMLSA